MSRRKAVPSPTDVDTANGLSPIDLHLVDRLGDEAEDRAGPPEPTLSGLAGAVRQVSQNLAAALTFKS